ncbi:MAG: hypothetical protein KKB37_08700, partial [Alphaproteobacteria bacterium]|nr:hypothetical protein [Alphaproteobacteria bacterium]
MNAGAGRGGQSGGGRGASAGGSPPAGAAPPPPKAAGSSGRGFFSTFTHLAAGVVGGAVALWAAEPLQSQFGIALAPPPQVPAVVEQRLAALEAASRNGRSDTLREDVSKLAVQIGAAEKRLGGLDALEQQLATLAKDIEQAKVGGQPAA